MLHFGTEVLRLTSLEYAHDRSVQLVVPNLKKISRTTFMRKAFSTSFLYDVKVHRWHTKVYLHFFVRLHSSISSSNIDMIFLNLTGVFLIAAVQCEDPAFDVEGDSGVIGTLKSSESALQLDIKGQVKPPHSRQSIPTVY